MKDARIVGAVDAPEAESRPEDRANEDWSWMAGEDPTFYLGESDWSRERD